MNVSPIHAHIAASAAQALIQQGEVARFLILEKGEIRSLSKGRAIQPVEELAATYADSKGRGQRLDMLA